MSFQENLIYYREKAGYKTGKEFADKLGISYPTYMAYENKHREPRYSLLVKIASLLHVSIDALLDYDPKQPDELQNAINLLKDAGIKFEILPTSIIVFLKSGKSDWRGEIPNDDVIKIWRSVIDELHANQEKIFYPLVIKQISMWNIARHHGFMDGLLAQLLLNQQAETLAYDAVTNAKEIEYEKTLTSKPKK